MTTPSHLIGTFFVLIITIGCKPTKGVSSSWSVRKSAHCLISGPPYLPQSSVLSKFSLLKYCLLCLCVPLSLSLPCKDTVLHILSFAYPYNIPLPLELHIRKATESLNCYTQLLGYWHQPRTVFDKILTPLFLITKSWLQVLILYKPLDSSWEGA